MLEVSGKRTLSVDDGVSHLLNDRRQEQRNRINRAQNTNINEASTPVNSTLPTPKTA